MDPSDFRQQYERLTDMRNLTDIKADLKRYWWVIPIAVVLLVVGAPGVVWIVVLIALGRYLLTQKKHLATDNYDYKFIYQRAAERDSQERGDVLVYRVLHAHLSKCHQEEVPRTTDK
jgi:hypothetical protein